MVKIRSLCVALMVTLLFPCLSYASLDDVYKSTVQVVADGVGTGVVVKVDDNDAYVLTAGHVILNDEKKPYDEYHVRLFYWGKPFKVKAEFVWGFLDWEVREDVGLVKFNLRDLKNYPKPIVTPLMEEDFRPLPEMVVESCGGPLGTWLTAWRGRVTATEEGNSKFTIIPLPHKGRSGSGVFYKDKVIGVIISTAGECVSATKIRFLINRDVPDLYKLLFE